jgi:putative transposase
MSRGDRQEVIFLDDEDRLRFLKTLGEACGKTGWEVHAYCLMGNHFHLVVETPQPTLVAGMKWFLGTYTQRFNVRHGMRGHLFAGRYKALLVDESDDMYLRVVCDYVHLNPVRAGLVAPEGELADYSWSSYPQYLKPPAQGPKWLRVDRLLGELGIRRDNAAGRREFREVMEARRRAEGHADEELWSGIRRGWRFGAEDFLERLVETGAAENANREIHQGEAVDETMEETARRSITEFLKKNKMGREELQARRKGDPLKIALAAELRRRTPMSMGWIARELNAGTPNSLWNALRERRKANGSNGKMPNM